MGLDTKQRSLDVLNLRDGRSMPVLCENMLHKVTASSGCGANT